MMEMMAGTYREAQMSQTNFEFESQRLRPEEFESDKDLGNVVYRQQGKAQRKFTLTQSRSRGSAVTSNRYLEFFGAILVIAGLLGFVIEWRLRPLHLRKI